ncbi:uncharacterized protein C2orf42 homolog isoform X2 [Protopterus annectens]|nr:uncharacterized protein C2orf42 homolog isoform X2 [Protopterus annectens]XP_043939062.1 uncharacterized protein C2orf42 homolog isoform X2 [Protopterus annectens]
MGSEPEKTKVPSFLSDLGRATLRGVRKCPKCGTFNGTRGLSCKNKSCGTVFRYGARKQQHNFDAVRIISGSDLQIFSVRQKDRGPEYRCFVELGIIQTTIQTDEGTVITHLSSGHCYVPSCFKIKSETILEGQCQHIQLAMECQTEAMPLTLKSSVLNSLKASPEIKQTIWQLATESEGPLVQRITKNFMVVKCEAAAEDSVGYVHVSFNEKNSVKSVGDQRFICSCQTQKLAKPDHLKEDAFYKCIHFYSCICAFASDEKLSQEFSSFLNFDSSAPVVKAEAIQLENLAEPIIQAEEVSSSKSKKKKKDDSCSRTAVQDGVNNTLRKSAPRKHPAVSSLRKTAENKTVDESQVSFGFLDWLASATEQINQTMHYQFNDKPEPLVFHIPHSFFDALQQRISMGSTKKRLPNSTEAFIRKDSLPLGTFSKYTWQITSILQVKQIFDTQEMPLQVTRSFIQNQDGTYESFTCPKVQVESIVESYGHERQPVIRPLELQTFLKVGNTTPDQKEPTPFIIEWIPDILPKSKIGELRIKFEYGHQQNGHIQYHEHHQLSDQTLGLIPLSTIAFT